MRYLILLAEVPGARRRGGEFDTYDSTGKTCAHPDDVRPREEGMIRRGIVLFSVLLAGAACYRAR